MDTTEKRSTDYDKELSVGTYAGKKIYETVVSLGSLAVGAWAGIMAAGKLMKPGVVQTAEGEVIETAKKLPGFFGKIPGLRGAFTSRQVSWGGIGGALVGSIAGGLLLGYEHWQKVKREQMQVDEITKDISDIEVFKKTDPELKAENERLWAELNKPQHKAATHAERVGKREHAEHAEHHEKREHHVKQPEHDSWSEEHQAAREHQDELEAAR